MEEDDFLVFPARTKTYISTHILLKPGIRRLSFHGEDERVSPLI